MESKQSNGPGAGAPPGETGTSSTGDSADKHKIIEALAVFLLPVVVAFLHWLGIPPLAEAVAWTLLVGAVILRAGPALRRAMGMLLILGLYAAMLLAPQGLET